MITILIPTFNRPDYLRRILSYYNDYEIAHNIIVADSSSNDNKEINAKTVSLLLNINVSYINTYSSEIDPWYKITDALENVNTKYCVICADDDFITPNGINQSVDFLEHNPDFTVAHGYYIHFSLRTYKVRRPIFNWHPLYSHESITSSDPKTRFVHHLSNLSQATAFAVHRSDILRMAIKETVEYTDDYRFGELLPSMLTLIYGKLKCVDVLYAAREAIPTSVGRIAQTLIDFITDGTYDYKYERFRECLSTHLSKMGQLDIEESGKVIDNAMSAHMIRFYPNTKINIWSRMSDILDNFNLPDWMDESIRLPYRMFHLLGHIGHSPNSMDIHLSDEYDDDFNKIRVNVLSHSRIYLR